MAGPAQPEPIAAPRVIADENVYIFQNQATGGTGGRQSKQAVQEPRRLLEDTGLLDHIREYDRPIDPCMYTLIDYMPNVLPQADTVFGGQEAVGRLDAAHGVSLVVQDGDLQILWGERRLWHTDTVGSKGVGVALAMDGRLVLLDDSGEEVWAAAADQMDPAACAPFKGQLRADGNLCVVDKRNMIVWDTKSGVPTLAQSAQRLDMQGTLYDVTQQQILSMRAITSLKPADIAIAFKLDPNMEAREGPTPQAAQVATVEARKDKKEKKAKKEKKHKKDKRLRGDAAS